MTLIDAMEGSKREIVLRETWGHLMPEPRRKYHGTILFALGDYENAIIHVVLDGLDSSPWFHDDLYDWFAEIYTADDYRDAIGVYQWRGYYQRFRNENHRFVGTIRKMVLK